MENVFIFNRWTQIILVSEKCQRFCFASSHCKTFLIDTTRNCHQLTDVRDMCRYENTKYTLNFNHLSLVRPIRNDSNSADSDQDAAADQGFHCLHKTRIIMKIKKKLNQTLLD